jgi:hypothetical protein
LLTAFSDNYQLAADCVLNYRSKTILKTKEEFKYYVEDLFKLCVVNDGSNSEQIINKKLIMEYEVNISNNKESNYYVEVCKTMFCFMYGISENMWKNCSSSFKNNPNRIGKLLADNNSVDDKFIPPFTWAEVEKIFKMHIPGVAIGKYPQ